jgi:uncharacterized protein YbjT (DUF2867 family)
VVESPMVLLLGASGFIGREIAARFLAAGYRVRAGARDPVALARRMPALEIFECDLNLIDDPSFWVPHLDGISAAINCAGILVASGHQDIDAIHGIGPATLFAACEEAGVRRVIHLSVPAPNFTTGTAYARTKQDAEQDLMARDLDWLILRPSLVVGRGAHGGTAVLRAIAASPWLLLPGDGDQSFSPITMEDLCAVMVAAVSEGVPARERLDLGGPEVLTLNEVVRALRAWLGFGARKATSVPGWLMRALAKAGDLVSSSALNTTLLLQMEVGNAVPAEATRRVLGREPERLADFLARCPSQTQDRWHAHLFLLRPALRATLALVWLASGLVGVFSDEAHAVMAGATHASESLARMTAVGLGLVDIGVAGLIVGPFDRLRVDQLQFLLVSGYTVASLWLIPSALMDPLGGLIKNLAVLATISVSIAIAEDR